MEREKDLDKLARAIMNKQWRVIARLAYHLVRIHRLTESELVKHLSQRISA